MVALRHARRVCAAVAVAVLAGGCTGSSPVGSNPDSGAGISVYGPYVDAEADLFAGVLDAFEQESGIPVSYTGSASFPTDFSDRIDIGDLPDVVVLPQPALIPRLVEQGLLNPLPGEEGQAVLDVVGGEWADVISTGGVVFAVPYRFVVKSLVWYRADVFEDRGYDIPASLDELDDLIGEMIDDGETPWCSGMDDAPNTGWWATDWVEDLVLRRSGAETYASWAALETSFDDQAVVSAMEEFQQLIRRPGAVRGGQRGVLNTYVVEAMDPMLEGEPGCLMHKQASFQSVWLPPDWSFDDTRLDVFALPGTDSDEVAPVVISGELAVATSADPQVQDLLLYLLEDEAFEPWRDVGGSLVARASREAVSGLHPLDARLVDLLAVARDVNYDASDLMPPEIGTDAFFEGMVDLVVGLPPGAVASAIQMQVDEIRGTPPDQTSDEGS